MQCLTTLDLVSTVLLSIKWIDPPFSLDRIENLNYIELPSGDLYLDLKSVMTGDVIPLPMSKVLDDDSTDNSF